MEENRKRDKRCETRKEISGYTRQFEIREERQGRKKKELRQ